MIIGVCGFCSTGSGAVSDYLKEFDELYTFDKKEFTIAYYPDGIEDLEYHLTKGASKYISSAVSIERFRRKINNIWVNRSNKNDLNEKIKCCSEEFLKNITQVKWVGHGNSDYILSGSNNKQDLFFLMQKFARNRMIPLLQRLAKKDLSSLYDHNMEFSINPDKFDEYAKKFINDLLIAYGCDLNKTIVLDQPFSGNNPQKSFKYFNNPKAIVVDRDPRDVYVFAKEFLKSKGKQIPTDNVDNFIVYYKNMRKDQPYTKKDKDVLLVRFEDMVYNYEETTKTIREFCNIEGYKQSKHIFEPKLSINNTQVFKRYPQYANDISKIEHELNNYLFDFEKYGNMEIRGEMFRGKSPLNK